ncbi:hypothetical protein [uncultured Flavobacterium sp.]|jgi:hypothetical protein|uniref:hypothetical protein n=1 Tax=uncultured Flavobacterium sp. TaxID=165435 RepID=UPI00308219C1
MLLKYIIIEKNDIPIIFPLEIFHSDVSVNVGTVKSAGFCILNLKCNEIYVKCFGESTSLKIKSNADFDEKAIKRSFFPKYEL